MKKFISILIALSMIFTLASCTSTKDKDKKEREERTTKKRTETTTKVRPDKETTEEFVTDEDVPTTNVHGSEDAPVESPTEKPTEAKPAPAPTPEESSPAPSPDVMSLEAIVNQINTETKKASKGNYSWTRTCEISKPFDFGSATSILNSIISGVDEHATLDTVIGGFFDVGTETAKVKNGAMASNMRDSYLLKAMSLKTSDVSSCVRSGDIFTLVINNQSNPQMDGSNGLNRITNDFYTEAQVSASIESVVGQDVIKVKPSNFSYKNIILTASFKNGKIESVKIQYELDITLNLSVGISMTGKGGISVVESYTNITY